MALCLKTLFCIYVKCLLYFMQHCYNKRFVIFDEANIWVILVGIYCQYFLFRIYHTSSVNCFNKCWIRKDIKRV